MLANKNLFHSELMVAEEAYPLAFSSSDHWKRFLNGIGDTTSVDERGYP